MSEKENIFRFLNLSSANMHKIAKAAKCCEIFHYGQESRGDGTPYSSHPTFVAETIIADLLRNDSSLDLTEDEKTTLICSAYLHDVLEDNPYLSYEDLETIFGTDITQTVFNVTKPKGPKKDLRSYFNKAFSSRLSGIVKLADRLHNLHTLNSSGNPRAKIKETIDYIVPVMYSCNPYLANKIYDELSRNLENHFVDGFVKLDEEDLCI